MFMFLCGLLIFLLIMHWILTRKYDYWKKRDVPYLKPVPILGNFGDYMLLKTAASDVVTKICKKFPDSSYIGVYYGTEPALVVQDLELLKLILTKDYFYFNGREVSEHSHKEAVTHSIFFNSGDTWRVLRQNLTPLFTSAKMKNMFYLVEKYSQDFEDFIDKTVRVSELVNVNTLASSFVMDCVGSCSFGIETNVMKDGGNNDFKKMGTLIFEKSSVRGIKNVFRGIWPTIFYALGFKQFPDDVTSFFMNLLTEVFKSRDYKPTSRNDLVDLVLTLRKENFISGDSIPDFKTGLSKKIHMAVTNDLLIGQCASFFGAGYETSATTLSLTIYQLAKNKKALQCAIEEVDEYMKTHAYKLEYDILTKLPYLAASINETLRLFPVLPNLTREVMADYTFPTGLRLKKGDRIHIPVYHIQRNPLYYDEPEEFRPERFLPSENHKIIPYTHMPFGEGPRLCLGMRFAKMQMLAGLATILKKYTLKEDETTTQKLTFDPRVIVTHLAEEIHVKFIRRNDH